ncbi:MAG: carbohydrate-binding protein [Chitinophagaceae bacterium]|nr:carbohydrate-binding protein [Oligoflexus sp.]
MIHSGRWLVPVALLAASILTSCKHVGSGVRSRDSEVSGMDFGGECPVSGNWVFMEQDRVKVSYDLSTGKADFAYDNNQKLHSFYAGVQLDKYVTSQQYASRSCTMMGSGVYEIHSTGNGLPEMFQTFTLNGGNKFLTSVRIEGSNQSTNWIAPVVTEYNNGIDLGSKTSSNIRVLWVPYDNDDHVKYNAARLAGNEGTSNEVAAFYDNGTRNGMVVGSVTHDTWKTGVYYKGRNKLNVFGGNTNKDFTHDVVAHGKIGGSRIQSPVVFVGYRDDWRDLMEEYADANAAIAPKMKWNGGVPFGWNSWGKIQTGINYDKAVAVSDFVKNRLQGSNFNNNGTVYINLDSFWDNMNDQQLRDFVAHAHANGQKAGIYWAPFLDWGKNADSRVRGSDTRYEDTWLRDNNNNPIEKDGAYAMDPTHPATKARINEFIDQFKNEGFEFVKLDFLTHGAFESTKRYDGNVKTGTQAYNMGMKYIADRIGGSMFISESIAPLFPSQYAHSRRVACDTFGAATGTGSSAYLLNSASYGWWMNGRVYSYNDPDQMVFQDYNSSENVVRLLSAVVTGTVFLAGDDLTSQKGQDLASYLLTNPRLTEVARLGQAFRPVEGDTGTDGSNVMVLHTNGRHFLAVFNFGNSYNYNISLARAGFSGDQQYQMIDQFDGSVSNVKGNIEGPLANNYAKLFELK